MRVPRPRRPAKKTPESSPRKAPGKSPAPVPSPASRAAPAPSPLAGAPAFPLVGLGASAGGLEAYEEFFRNVPADVAMAFVVVSHLDPSHESILTEIIQRCTPLPVVEATDQLVVKPGCVYVIPPNRDLTIFRGALQLSEPVTPRGHRLPIDSFFRSLAEDQGEHAIGAVLSGTGADGSLGLRAILGAGGITFAQDPATARYDGMPMAAIRGGYATHVLPVGRMPEAMQTLARAMVARAGLPGGAAAMRGVTQVLSALRSRTGHDFSQYKKSTVVRRIERRMVQHGIESAEVYARYVKEHPEEASLLFKELLINVTSFFRDPEAFETLRTEVLPRILAGKPEGWVFRVWVAACASGEEAYSIAMLLRERMDETRLDFRVQIYATDLDEDAIAIARAGVYSPNITQDVTPERLRRFFLKEEAGFRIKKEIREMVVFAIQNLTKDPPFTRIDLVSCRNLLIYLEPELQDRIVSTFHFALNAGGVLFLSPSESLGQGAERYRPLSRKWKLFETIPPANASRGVPAGPVRWTDPGEQATPSAPAREVNVADLTVQSLLATFAPASVVTNQMGEIVYVHGDTGRYLRPAPGKATLNVIEMARGDLAPVLRAAFQGVSRQGSRSATREVPVRIAGTVRTVLLTVRPLGTEGRRAGLLLVSFEERSRPAAPRVTAGKGPARRSKDSRRPTDDESALAQAKALLRTTVEEQQASTEELKSMNEELQSTNEELQSTNEELETSKEELQSLNEELVTVNSELLAKVDQLRGMQNDMRNLLDNVSGGVIFLDRTLTIRRFTREATRLFRLVPTDVGRHLADIKGEARGDRFVAGARVVLETLVPWEQEIPLAGGGTYLARIQPYRTLDNVIDGVVMAFTDITARVAADAAVQEARRVAESIVDAVREPLLVLDPKLMVVSASRAFYEQFRVTPEETVGRAIHDLGDRQWNIPALRQLLEAVQVEDRAFDDFVVEHDFPRVGHRRLVLNARRILNKSPERQLILLAISLPPPLPTKSGEG